MGSHHRPAPGGPDRRAHPHGRPGPGGPVPGAPGTRGDVGVLVRSAVPDRTRRLPDVDRPPARRPPGLPGLRRRRTAGHGGLARQRGGGVPRPRRHGPGPPYGRRGTRARRPLGEPPEPGPAGPGLGRRPATAPDAPGGGRTDPARPARTGGPGTGPHQGHARTRDKALEPATEGGVPYWIQPLTVPLDEEPAPAVPCPGRNEAPAAPESLTEAERRVASLAAEGRSNRQIATQLYITVSTVEQHLTRVYRKLSARRRSELPDLLALGERSQPHRDDTQATESPAG
ncbi:helix-turn-helix transcriptional regulator [Streptomyces sp. LBUM 1476]|nr:helix-turn-helix transcriptional regulator [Streptomyces sp. LBUM 1476]